jgi:hypothetical protein
VGERRREERGDGPRGRSNGREERRRDGREEAEQNTRGKLTNCRRKKAYVKQWGQWDIRRGSIGPVWTEIGRSRGLEDGEEAGQAGIRSGTL